MKSVSFLSLALLFFMVTSLTSCSDSATVEELSSEASIPADDENALALIDSKCFLCHNPNLDADARLAPPLSEIRTLYYRDDMSRGEFITSIEEFVKEPTKELALMSNAVSKYGVMPKQHYETTDLKIIAGYMYDNDLSSDAWYTMWNDRQGKTNASDYLKQGKEIALATKSVLGQNLMQALQKEGVMNALEFCTVRAIPLTDSMSVVLNAKVKRVSDKPRNPMNAASKEELEIMNRYNVQMKNKKMIQPEVKTYDDYVVGYYPIETNSMCLQCHGKVGKDVSLQTDKMIKKYYPNDKATGYASNELRGLFVIEMQKR